jgi:hypothetical protein
MPQVVGDFVFKANRAGASNRPKCPGDTQQGHRHRAKRSSIVDTRRYIYCHLTPSI